MHKKGRKEGVHIDTGGQGDFALVFSRMSRFRQNFISRIVPSLLWEILHPHAVTLRLSLLNSSGLSRRFHDCAANFQELPG